MGVDINQGTRELPGGFQKCEPGISLRGIHTQRKPVHPAARTAAGCKGDRSSAAIWLRCAARRFQPMNQRQHGGRASGELTEIKRVEAGAKS
jgi:hypothetical protein